MEDSKDITISKATGSVRTLGSEKVDNIQVEDESAFFEDEQAESIDRFNKARMRHLKLSQLDK